MKNLFAADLRGWARVVFFFFYFGVMGMAQSKQTADVIYVNGKIYVGDEARLAQRNEALAVKGDRLLAVGDAATVKQFKGGDTKVVDLHGAFVMPGFNDAHVHLAN